MKFISTFFLYILLGCFTQIFAQRVDSTGIYYRQSIDYFNHGKRTNSTEMLHKAAAYSKKNTAIHKDTLGFVFLELGKETIKIDKTQSMAYFKTAETLLENSKNMDTQQKLSEVYDNLGDIHSKFFLLDETFIYYNKSFWLI